MTTAAQAPPRAKDFRSALHKLLNDAEAMGLPSVDIIARQLHQFVGGYPSEKNRMPACCSVMMREMCEGDQVISAPPSGKGASLVIRYQLPRQLN